MSADASWTILPMNNVLRVVNNELKISGQPLEYRTMHNLATDHGLYVKQKTVLHGLRTLDPDFALESVDFACAHKPSLQPPDNVADRSHFQLILTTEENSI